MKPALFALCALMACHRVPISTTSPDAAATQSCDAAPVVTVRRATTFPGTAAGAYALARALASSQGPRLAASLRPDSVDYAAVFDVDLARRMEDWSPRLWDSLDPKTGVAIGGMGFAHDPSAGPREVDLFALTPKMLSKPGSYLCGKDYVTSGIEKHIQPGLTVYCYGFRTLDQGTPPLVDALMYVHGHWALFPRPNDVPATVYVAGCPPHVTTDPAPLVVQPEMPPTVVAPWGPDAARALLSRMIATGDARDQVAKLEPTLEDVRALYKEPQASQLFAAMKPKWAAFRGGASLLKFEPVVPSPTDQIVQLHTATTEALLARGGACPTGYFTVAQYLVPNAVIYCFGFAEIGRGSGQLVDGLTYVRGHWVLVPRPWEVLGAR